MRPMAHAFSQAAVRKILPYANGMHPPGSRSVILGPVTLAPSQPLPLILLAHSLPPHLMTNMSVSGGSQIDEPLPPSSTHPPHHASLSPWTATTSSAEVAIR
jgi:hypothetical protein